MKAANFSGPSERQEPASSDGKVSCVRKTWSLESLAWPRVVGLNQAVENCLFTTLALRYANRFWTSGDLNGNEEDGKRSTEDRPQKAAQSREDPSPQEVALASFEGSCCSLMRGWEFSPLALLCHARPHRGRCSRKSDFPLRAVAQRSPWPTNDQAEQPAARPS